MKEQLLIAVPLALEFHADQMYGDSKNPYIYHLNGVDQLIISVYSDNKREPSEPYSKEPGDLMDLLRSLSYLHDIIEDTECTYQILRDRGICERLIHSVCAITKVEGEDYLDYMRRVLSNDLAKKVKIADTVFNLSHSIFDGATRRVEKYKRQLDILKGFEVIS